MTALTPDARAEHAEGGTVLQPSEAAIIWDARGEPRLAIPDMPDDAQVPPHIMILMAIFIRFQRDSQWRGELLRWFKRQKS